MNASRICAHFEVVHMDGTRTVLETQDIPLDPGVSLELLKRSVHLAVAFLAEKMESASSWPAEHHGAD